MDTPKGSTATATLRREFQPERDSVVYRSVLDLAAHLGLQMSGAFRRELALFAAEVEVAQQARTRELIGDAMVTPLGGYIYDGRRWVFGPRMIK